MLTEDHLPVIQARARGIAKDYGVGPSSVYLLLGNVRRDASVTCAGAGRESRAITERGTANTESSSGRAVDRAARPARIGREDR
jgi:hypothetical protein